MKEKFINVSTNDLKKIYQLNQILMISFRNKILDQWEDSGMEELDFIKKCLFFPDYHVVEFQKITQNLSKVFSKEFIKNEDLVIQNEGLTRNEEKIKK